MRRLLFLVPGLLLAAGCAGQAPFGFADDRCAGATNRCVTSCLNADELARAACEQRCLEAETRCYQGAGAGTPESLAAERAVGQARTRAEKEAGYSAWRITKEREREAAEGEDAEPEPDDGGR